MNEWIVTLFNNHPLMFCVLYALMFISIALITTLIPSIFVKVWEKIKKYKINHSSEVPDFGMNPKFSSLDDEEILNYLTKYMGDDQIVLVDHEIYFGGKIKKIREQYFRSKTSNMDCLVSLN